MCEQVYSVSTERVNNYIGQCTDKEMENIDIALMISLSLDGGVKTTKKYTETIKKQEEEIAYYRKKIQGMEWEQQERAKTTTAAVPETAAVNNASAGAETEALIRAESERDTYKALYDNLLNRLVNGGTA